MATGDNALTGMCVGQKCGILNSEEYFIADLVEVNNTKQLYWENEFRENIMGKKIERGDLPGEPHSENDQDEMSAYMTESRYPSSVLLSE